MIEAIEFNTTNKFVSNYEGITPLVRTGTVKSSSLKSFCNALLLTCSKKFIIENDDEKMRSIDKLETDFKLMHEENNILSKFYSDLTEKMHSILNEFYNFIENNQYKIEENQQVLKLIHTLFDENNFNDNNDDDTSSTKKVDVFITIKGMLTVTVLKKITKLKEHRAFDSLSGIKTLLLKDVKHFLKFQDILIDEDKSRFIKSNTLLLVEKIFDIASECIDLPKFDSDTVDNFHFEIATKHFLCNLFIIDSKTENIKIATEYNHKLKSIILLSFENYFEVVGKLRQSNIINRQFFPYEDIIQSILFQLSGSSREGVIVTLSDGGGGLLTPTCPESENVSASFHATKRGRKQTWLPT